jgi:hypothetical protein
MKNKLFIKLMARQPVITALLVLLITISSFVFVMRSVEYMVVTEQIDEISSFYRSIIFITHDDDPMVPVDVTDAANIIAQSDQVAFEDRRRSAEGVLQDGLLNFNVLGMICSRLIPDINDSRQHVLTDSFFYGELVDVIHNEEDGFVHLDIMVDYVVVGYPEHIEVGQPLEFRNYFSEDRQSPAIDGMVVGERYFLRGAYYQRYFYVHFDGENRMEMRPINELTYNPVEITGRWYRHLEDEPLWYIPVADKSLEEIIEAPLKQLIEEEISRVRHSQGAVQFITTTDMTAIPYIDSRYGSSRIVDGRAINLDDYLNARPVVVIYEHLAANRDIQLGDILTIAIPKNQRAWFYQGVELPHFDTMSRQTVEHSDVLELEVIGVWGRGSHAYFGEGRNVVMYIPDSILSPSFSLLPSELRGTQIEPGFLASGTYSFVLNTTRHEEAFLISYREKIAGLGFGLDTVPTGAWNFWDSAELILQGITFNLILFCVVLVLLLALVSYLYFRQRRKDIAIQRVLGRSAGQVYVEVISSMLFYGLPAIVAGGVGGWFFALREAEAVLNPLANIVDETTTTVNLPIYWLFIFSIVVLFILVFMITIGIMQINRSSVLELLQGSTTKIKPLEQKESVRTEVGELDRSSGRANDDSINRLKVNKLQDSNLASGFSVLNNQGFPVATKGKNTYAWHFIYNHILRSKLKTALVLVISLISLLTLSFLQESISSTGDEIDRMYATTIVDGELRHPNSHLFFGGAGLTARKVDMLLEKPFVQNEFLQAGYPWLMVIPADSEGNMPENWGELLIDGGNKWAAGALGVPSDLSIALSDFEKFTITHSRGVLDDAAPRLLPNGLPMEYFQVDFMEGFDESSFVFTEGEAIPLIMPLERSHANHKPTINMGDKVYLGLVIGETPMRMGEWVYLPAVVIGTHNQNILMTDNVEANWYMSSFLMPHYGLRTLQGEETKYITVDFEIDLAWNRELSRILEEFDDFVSHSQLYYDESYNIIIHDEELRSVVVPLEENLSLLQMLYPIAIGLLVIISLIFNMILMLQNAKNAAIMRVLGSSKSRSRIVLWMESMLTNFLGLIVGLLIVLVLGWGFGIISMLGLAALCFIGAALGSFFGALLITNRAPLDLLQVKE